MLIHSLPLTKATTLSSSRLILRPYQPDMAFAFWQLIHDNRERLQADFPDRTSAVITLEDAERRLRSLHYQWNSGSMYGFGVWSKETGDYVGDVTLRRVTRGKPYGEVGYYLSAETEGQGFATEALKAVIRFAFQELRMNTISLRCAEDNMKSQKVAERCGFTRSTTLSFAISKKPEEEDRIIFTYRLKQDDAAAQLIWESF